MAKGKPRKSQKAATMLSAMEIASLLQQQAEDEAAYREYISSTSNQQTTQGGHACV